MASEIRYIDQTGLTFYAVLVRDTDGKLWNGSTFENPLAANWANYPITLTEQSTVGMYYGNMPAAGVGAYDILIYQRAGGSPATTDAPPVGMFSIAWSGTAVYNVNSLTSLLDDARGEPGQGAPPVNPDLATKIDYLFKAWRNKKTQSASQTNLYADDASTVDQKATVSDDGTTTTVGEMASGP